jgi:hypothetical protein
MAEAIGLAIFAVAAAVADRRGYKTYDDVSSSDALALLHFGADGRAATGG